MRSGFRTRRQTEGGLGLLVSCSLLTALSVTVLAAPPGPVKLSKAASGAVTREIEKDRADTQAWLKSDPTSYLATIDRRDFEQKTALTIGRAPDNDVRVEDPAFSAHHLRVSVDGDRFRVQAVDAGARFTAGKNETREAVVEPSSVKVGRYLLRLSHQRFPGIIVFDPESPRFKLYKGLSYFPVDLSYRYELSLTANPRPETIVIMSTRGNQRHAQRVGSFEFMAGTTAVRLEAVRLLEPGVGRE
jgi:hypothetical protein